MPRNPQSDKVWDTIRNPDCNLCSLCESAQTICLLGDGPVPCDAMAIGEAPGLREDELEIPFSGKSGKLLRNTLREIGIDLATIYITNVVSCRPPGNRTPTRSEAKTCSTNFLNPQVQLVKPKVILLLGNTALAWALGRKGSITKAEGITFKKDGITYVPSRHPASLLRAEGSPEYPFLLQKLRENLLLFKRTLYPSDEVFKFKRRLPRNLDDGPICTDIETDGLNPFREDAVIHCMGLAQNTDSIHSVPCEESDRDYYRDLFSKHPIIAQRGTFEGIWIKSKYGITPRIHFDTKLGAFLIDENDQSGLKYQAIKCLGVEPWVEEMDFQNPDMDLLLPYNARDTKYELRLYKERDIPHLKKFPKQARLLKYILLPAMEVFIDVICNGFHIDEKQAQEKLDICYQKMEEINSKVTSQIGHDINLGSPKQVSSLLYEELGLTCPVKTSKGANSSSEAALIRLLGQHPVVDDTMEWRKWKKYESTYLGPWIEHGPILHANYGFTDTDTGRLNSTMVKNKRGEKKRGATLHQCPRDAFIRNLINPRHPDWCIVAADLSQAELRLAAHAADEKVMIEIFNSGEDIHLATARTLQPKGEITKETRKKAKAVNFGFLYGMWAKKFIRYAKEKFGLDLTLRQGYSYREQFFDKYPDLLPWHRRVEAFVSRTGWIDSVFGRRRHLPEARVESGYDEYIRNEAVRKAINSPIQSAASDLDLLIAALIASQSLDWQFKINPKKCLAIGAAHDSLLFECHKKYAAELREGILWTVVNLPLKKYFNIQFKVPIKMDVVCYKNHWEGEVLDVS